MIKTGTKIYVRSASFDPANIHSSSSRFSTLWTTSLMAFPTSPLPPVTKIRVVILQTQLIRPQIRVYSTCKNGIYSAFYAQLTRMQRCELLFIFSTSQMKKKHITSNGMDIHNYRSVILTKMMKTEKQTYFKNWLWFHEFISNFQQFWFVLILDFDCRNYCDGGDGKQTHFDLIISLVILT